MAKSFVLDRLELLPSNEIFLRMCKVSSDGDRMGTHYVCFYPGENIDTVAENVNLSIVEMGYGIIPVEFVARVKAIADLTWTAEVVAAYQAAQAAAEAARNS